MKRLLFSALLFCSAAIGAMGATTLQLVFRTTSGATHSFDTKELTMDIADGSMTVKNSYTSKVFSLTDLAAMYFENGQSGIKSAEVDFNSAQVEIFTLSGVSAGKFNSLADAMKRLTPGIYLCGSHKFQVK